MSDHIDDGTYETEIQLLRQQASVYFDHSVRSIAATWRAITGREPSNRERLSLASTILIYGLDAVERAAYILAYRAGYDPGDAALEQESRTVELTTWAVDALTKQRLDDSRYGRGF